MSLYYREMEGISEDQESRNIIVRLNDLKPQRHCGNQRCLILICNANSPITWKFEDVLEVGIQYLCFTEKFFARNKYIETNALFCMYFSSPLGTIQK